MIYKPYSVGCGVQLNPNGSDLRCGQDTPYQFNQQSKGMALCEQCRIKQQANVMAEIAGRVKT